MQELKKELDHVTHERDYFVAKCTRLEKERTKFSRKPSTDADDDIPEEEIRKGAAKRLEKFRSAKKRKGKAGHVSKMGAAVDDPVDDGEVGGLDVEELMDDDTPSQVPSDTQLSGTSAESNKAAKSQKSRKPKPAVKAVKPAAKPKPVKAKRANQQRPQRRAPVHADVAATQQEEQHTAPSESEDTCVDSGVEIIDSSASVRGDAAKSMTSSNRSQSKPKPRSTSQKPTASGARQNQNRSVGTSRKQASRIQTDTDTDEGRTTTTTECDEADDVFSKPEPAKPRAAAKPATKIASTIVKPTATVMTKMGTKVVKTSVTVVTKVPVTITLYI